MGSLYPTDIVVEQRGEERKTGRENILSTDAGRRKRKKISARYTFPSTCILFVVGPAAAFIGSSII